MPACAAGTIRKIVVGGRGTYVCERCQPSRAAASGDGRAAAPAVVAPGRGSDRYAASSSLSRAGAVRRQQLVEAADASRRRSRSAGT